MSTTVMHIDKRRTLTGRMRTYCGVTLARGQGAPEHAPLCPQCQRRAGWGEQDRRRPAPPRSHPLRDRARSPRGQVLA